ncbi:MAG: tRNA pseudouridine(13) synthase TruD [Planctomycetota bacterium]
MTEPSNYLTHEITGIGGSIKNRDSDFIVEELPLYEPSGEGEHLYLFVEKRGMPAGDLVGVIASHFGVRRSAVGMAGKKDTAAVTRQLVSVHLPGVSEDGFGMLRDERVGILWVDRHGNKLRMGHLAGNRFNIRIRDVGMQDVLSAHRVLGRLQNEGVPNAFGPQRFGAKGTNARRGIEMLRRGKPSGSPGTARQLLNAVQSAVFNRVLDDRLKRVALGSLEEGDLAWVHGSGAVFEVGAEELAADGTGARLASLEISPSGPMWGAAMTRASAAVDAAETDALERVGVTAPELEQPAFRKLLPGARRPLRVPVAEWDVEGGIDEHGSYVRVAFDLPPGAYATSVLREIMKPLELASEPEPRDG